MEHSSADRTGFSFSSRGDVIRGVVHTPSNSTTGVLLLHGWGTCRLGPERSFIRFSEQLSGKGVTVFRIDLPGRGESGGDCAEVTVDRMGEAAADCMTHIREEYPDLKILGMGGICSGANTAVLASLKIKSDFLLLWSMFPFKGGASAAVKARRTGHFLGIYFRKLFSMQSWRKLFSGSLQFRKIFRILFSHYRGERTDLQETSEDVYGQLGSITCPVQFVYGENDPDGPPSLDHFRECAEKNGMDAVFEIIPGASHNFYLSEWQEKLVALSYGFVADRIADA